MTFFHNWHPACHTKSIGTEKHEAANDTRSQQQKWITLTMVSLTLYIPQQSTESLAAVSAQVQCIATLTPRREFLS